MKEKVKKGVLTGLGFSGLAFLTVKLLGFNRKSFMVLSYLYVASGVVITIIHEKTFLKGFLERLAGNIVIVEEGEEVVLRRIFTGEKYEIKGSLEKVQ
ncbi:MAG: hypothetical protein ABEJ75_02895 [Candidatus Nanohaloarchaea archaeon]